VSDEWWILQIMYWRYGDFVQVTGEGKGEKGKRGKGKKGKK
jgi:hypothetical protein